MIISGTSTYKIYLLTAISITNNTQPIIQIEKGQLSENSNLSCTGSSSLESWWLWDHPDMEKKKIIIIYKILKFYDFFTLKKLCDHPKFF